MNIRFAGRLAYIAFLVALAILVASCGKNTHQGRELKLSIILGVNSHWYQGADRFRQLVEERTHGAYRIRIFPHAQLANGVQRTEMEMVQSGAIDLSLESTITLSLLDKRMGIPSLPWLFRDYRQAHHILSGPLGSELLDVLPEKHLVGLAFGANGFRQLTNSRNPVRIPEDLRGMKVRIPAIRMYIRIFKLFGADPSSMNFGELFTALAQGTMDGQENPAAVIFSSRLYEVQKYLSAWNYSYDPIVLCMNAGLWNTLTPETREIFRQCAREAMEYEFSLLTEGEAAAYDSLRAKGMEIDMLSLESIVRFGAMTEPIYREYAREMKGNLIDRFRAAVREDSISCEK